MLIAREKEIARLREAYLSDNSEFVAIYGRRRVGKTFLVKEVLGSSFTFQYTGVANASLKEQLAGFEYALKSAGATIHKPLAGWLEAFEALAEFLKNVNVAAKKVVFLDELPWLDSHKARFIPAFEHFWNGFAALRNDILLVTCGSATSWIIKNIINSHGGLHNRVTCQIYLRPFTLGECEKLAQSKGLVLSRNDVLLNYMVFGGIPYYWTLLRKGLSQPQNIDSLCFTRGGELVGEYHKLYASLFKNPEPYMAIIEALASKKKGLNREQIIKAAKIGDSGKLTKYLDELEQCDFIRRFNTPGNTKKNAVFQLIDSFTLFYHSFMEKHVLSSGPLWLKVLGKPAYNAWVGLAFERVCFMHIDRILAKLGISGVITSVYSWQTPHDAPEGAQIDMLIDREDGVVNICEMKYSDGEYAIDKTVDADLKKKLSLFRQYCRTRKALHLTMVTTYGLTPNQYSSAIQSQILAEDLF